MISLIEIIPIKKKTSHMDASHSSKNNSSCDNPFNFYQILTNVIFRPTLINCLLLLFPPLN